MEFGRDAKRLERSHAGVVSAIFLIVCKNAIRAQELNRMDVNENGSSRWPGVGVYDSAHEFAGYV